MTTIDDALARCAALRDDGPGAGEADVAWLVGCFDHPLKVVQRTAGETLVALAALGVDVTGPLERAMELGPFRRRWVAAWTAARMPGVGPASLTPVLLEAIGVDDGDIRWAAARILTSATPTPTTVARLLDLTRDGNAEQRKMAVYCLRDLGAADVGTVARYRAALGDAAAGVRLAAMSALARSRPADSEDARRIAGCLEDPDGGVRRAAAATLGRMGVADDEVVGRLGGAAQSDDAVLGRTARAALARLAQPAATRRG